MVATDDILLSSAKKLITCRPAHFEEFSNVHRLLATERTITTSTFLSALESELFHPVLYYYLSV